MLAHRLDPLGLEELSLDLEELLFANHLLLISLMCELNKLGKKLLEKVNLTLLNKKKHSKIYQM